MAPEVKKLGTNEKVVTFFVEKSRFLKKDKIQETSPSEMTPSYFGMTDEEFFRYS